MAEYIVKESGYPGTLSQEVVGELIRCKDCKYFYEEPDDPDWGRCNCSAWHDGDGGDQEVRPTDYCSFAERKEGEADG